MKPVWQQFTPAQLGDTVEKLRDNLGGFTTKMAYDLQRILSNGATFKDNIASAIIEFDAQHGVETRVANPLRSVPLTFIPISAMSITAIGGPSNGVQRKVMPYPQLNTSRTDGFLGITVDYAPSSATVSSVVTFTNAANLAPATVANVTSVVLPAGVWNLTSISGYRPPATSWVALQTCMSVGASATLTGNDTIGLNRVDTLASGLVTMAVPIPNFETTVTSSTTVYLCSRWDGVGTAQIFGRLSGRMVAPDPATLARVRGILVEA